MKHYIHIRKFLIQHRMNIALYIMAFVISFLVIFLASIYSNSQIQNDSVVQNQSPATPSIPEIIPFTSYEKPDLAPAEVYNIYLIGDSMTHAFGPRGGVFNEIISREYPNSFFEISNYAMANQNILLLPERLKQSVQADHDLLLVPILEGDPDLIIIESFGYNPLSQFGIEEGLKRQEELLTEVMTTLTNRFPNASVMFFAAIAPDKTTYGQAVTESSAEARWAQAEERIEYITNHIDYANEHNIPVINAYAESLDLDGDGDTLYINPDDNIHPSAEGLALMGRIMTRRIQEENIFPTQ